MEEKLKKSGMGMLRFTTLLLLGLLFFSHESKAQTTYSAEGFNSSLSLFSVTNGASAYRTGNSGTGDRPASSPYAYEGTHGFACVNDNITLQSTVINTQGICGASFSFDLAAFSLGSTSNGLDGGDAVRIDISPDNGNTYYRTLDITGNNNAYWAYSATGVASTAYDGNANTVTFAPAGSGSRTTDGYSTVQISNLPNVSQLIIRIYLATSSNSEGWVIDDFKIQGNPPSAMSTTPATRCTPGTLTLGATANGCGLTPTIAWFSASSGGSALQSNTTNPSSFTTPSLSSTTSYYVEQQYAAGVGIGTNTGNIITTGVGLAFTAHTSFTLNSVAMRIRKNSAADGAMTVLIKDNAGTVINTINLVIPGAANNNNNNTYNIGHTFTPGNYTIEVSAMSANISRVYFTSGMSYPLHYGALSFTGNVGNTANTYNYFYDWNISLPRQEVIATIGTNVTPSVSVSSSDADNSICSGTSVTFTATPTNGGSAPTYQWKLNGNNVGTNSATYTNSGLANNDVVTVVMTANNACQTSATANGNSITTSVNTTVSPSVSIVSDDADNFICDGSMIVFTATPTNGGTSPVYQWKINGMDMGSNTSTFNTNVLINGDVVSVQMTTNHLCQTQATSNSNSLTISVGLNTAPSVSISSSDADNVVCQGSSVTYTAIPTNGGSSPSYQWVLNGNNVGTNSSTFSNAVNSNQTVSVIMTSNYQCQTSSSATATALDVTVLSNVNPSVIISSSVANNAICAGESVTFTATPTNGGPSPSYQWKLNGANVGTNAATYTTTTLPNNGIVSVVMTANNECQTSANANGNNISTSVTNNVTPAVSVSSTFVTNAGNATWGFGTANSTAVANLTISALSQNNNFGTNAILSGTSNSGGAYTGASGGNNAQATTINGALNTNTSTYFQFTVTPSATYSFTLNNLSMGMRSTGTGPTGYVLRSSLDNYASDIFVGSVATNSTWSLKTHALSTGNVSAIGQAVTYRIYGYGGTGATINNANWRIDDLVLSFVNSQSVCEGTNVTFTANPTNGGSSPIYQWTLNGSNVGTNATTYSNNNLVNGDVVAVSMTANNACQTSSVVFSSNTSALLLENEAASVSISSSNLNNTVCIGSSASFTATPNFGGNNPTYQWRINGTNVGTNSNVYSNATMNDNDVVTVVMTSNRGCVTPAVATSNAITVDIQTSLLTTTGASNCGTGNLTVSASSSCNVPGSSISWFANATGGTALATTSSYTANYSASTTVYAQENFVGGETVYGNDNTGTANRGLQFTLYTDITLNSVNIESDGTANITIQLWNAATNAPMVVNGNTYSATVPVVNGNNVETLGWFIPAGVGYRLVVTNMGGRNLTRTPNFTFPESLPGVGSITGNVDTGGTDRYNFFYNWNYSTVRVPATVTITTPVTPSVTVTSSDVDNSICSGTNVTFTATPTNGGSTPAYQWKLNGTNVGTDATTYTNASLSNNDVVTVVMTANNTCQTTSTANGNSITTAVLTQIAPSVVVSSNDADNSICFGTSVTFTATPTNGGSTPSYQWKLNGFNVGTNSTTYTNAFVANNDVVSVVMTANNACQSSNTATSNSISTSVILNFTPSVWISSSDINNSICNGESVTFTATPFFGGNAPIYQWKLNGTNVGTDATTYTNASLSNNDVVTVVMTANNVCQTASNVNGNSITTTVTNNVTPSVTIAASATDICPGAGTSVTFTATPTNGGTPSYQWKKNGTNVGTNASTFTSTTLSGGDVITVVMTATNSCQTTNTATSAGTTINALTLYTYYQDNDGDGYGQPSSSVQDCSMPNGYSSESGDCNDNNADVYPFNLEICNGIDDDCSGAADNGLTSYTFYADQDGDGYGSNSATIVSCDFVAGYLMTNGDCNDALSTVNPQANELCSTSYDDDCDGLINEVCNVVNDDPLFSNLIIPATSLVSCNTVAGNLGGASPSAQVGVQSLNGTEPDTWYYFTATSPGVTIRCIPTNDVKLELRTGAGLLVKSANAVNGIGDEYLNYGELTVGGQYYVRVMQMDSPTLGGSFTLCTRRITSSGNLNYTNSILYDSGCDVVYASSITGSTSCSIQLTPISPAGGPVLTGSGAAITLSNFNGPNGEKFQYNTTYQATITLGFVLPVGNGGTEVINVSRISDNNLVVQQHLELDLGSVHACPARVSIGGTVRANIWLCDAERYQWKFEKTVNGILQLVNGNPVVIEVYGPLGTRDFVPSALMGFTAGSEWRVQVRPIFANNVVGNYGTNYQCMKFKGTAASMPTVEEEDEFFKDMNQNEALSLMLFPNPSGRSSVNVIWNASESEDVQLIVRDMQGRVVQRIEHIQGNQFVIDGSDLSGGMYWVEWHSGANTQRLRWMIQ